MTNYIGTNLVITNATFDTLGMIWTNVPSFTTNSLSSMYELFLMGGEPDQFFQLQSTTNLTSADWSTNATLEMFDPSGTLYILRTRPVTNTPPVQFYRTVLAP